MTHPTHTAVQIPDEAVQAAVDAYREEAKKEITYLPVMMRSALAAATPHLSAPCAVEVKKLTWPSELGCNTVIDAGVARYRLINSYDNVYRCSSVPYNEGAVSLCLNTTLEEAKAAAQSDFERRILSCVVTKPVDVLTPSEAVFGLLVWLTSRKETVVLGASHGAAIGADLASTFCKENNLGECRDEFPSILKHPAITSSQPVDVAAVREAQYEKALQRIANLDEAMGHELNENHAFEAVAIAIRALVAEPAQDTFDSADWFYRDNDPDDSGDTAYEAIVNHPEYSVHLVHSSYRGDSRFVFRAPTLNQDDDNDETLNFATEEEAMAAVIERKKAIEEQTAAPTTEAGK